MSISFHPDHYGVQIISKWTSDSGRWIIFYGTHFTDKGICYDVGMFNTHHGATQRLHFNDNKTGAILSYDETKNELTKLARSRAQHEEPSERYHILGPNGRPTD